ncbi:MAG: ATP-binding cassette domain-containing protein [Chloroflexota bacterium]
MLKSNEQRLSESHPEGSPLIEMRGISKVFRTPAGDFPALKDIDAAFVRGEFVSVVGKSGSGKSTLVNMLTGIDHPTAGSVQVDGRAIHNLSENAMSIWRGRNLGIVFQFFQLLPTLTLLENVMLPMDFAGAYDARQRTERALALLERVGLGDWAEKLPGAVSGGQQQAAAVARALANDPPIVIADEPTGNLDSRTADEVFGIFLELARQGKTVIMVTHDASLARRTNRMLLLCDGELIETYIAAALPRLAHRRLLWLTHRMQVQEAASGERLADVAQPGCPEGPTGLYLVTSGMLQVQRHTGEVLAKVEAGELFGLQDALVLGKARGGQAAGTLELRVDGRSEMAAQVLSLSGVDFRQWMDESPASGAYLEQRAWQHWGEMR